MRVIPVLCAIAVSMGGCIGAGDDASCDSEKCDSPSGNGDVIPTQNGNAELLTGYHALFDKTSSVCVEPESSNGAAVKVGAVSGGVELVYVQTREEIARELGIDLGLKVKYRIVGSADLGLNLLSKFSSNSRSVNLLLKLDRSYTVTNRHQLQLRQSAGDKLAAGPQEFTRTCGTHYVNGIRYGANLYLLITYSATSTDVAESIKASLGISGGNPALQLEGDLETRLSTLAKRSDVNVTVRAAARGFKTDVDIGDLIAKGISEEMFDKVDEVRADVDASIEGDICRDAGLPDCGGAPGPGFADNTLRIAMATGLEVGFYDSLPNVDVASRNPFAEVRERILVVERFVRGWAELQERIEDIYWSELDPFLNATSSSKGGYQVVPPADPMQTPNDMNDLANQWMDKFFPPVGSQIGFTTQTVVDTIADCWSTASIDIFESCVEGDVEAEDMESWNAVLAEIEQYRETARILPMRIVVGTEAKREGSAEDYCRTFNTPQTSYRLPTLAELGYIDPMIAFGNVDWNGDVPHEIWYRNDSGECSENTINTRSSYVNPPGGEPRFECSTLIHTAAVICVASSGPAPLSSDP